MPMTYSEFTAYITSFLWRTGDPNLEGQIDNLIGLADAELSRSLRVEERAATQEIPVTALSLPLPDDYQNMRDVMMASTSQILPPFTYVRPTELLAMRQQAPASWVPFYSLSDTTLMLSGPIDPDNPVSIAVVYYRSIPDYKDTDTSWVADSYLDLYTWAVLKNASAYVREDERIQVWEAKYQAALQNVLEESEFYRKRGPNASKPLPRQAGINRRKNRGKAPY